MTRTSAKARRSLLTLGAMLERDRLERRARRLEGVVAALRARARDHASRDAKVPGALAASLEDFQRELMTVRGLLSDIDPGSQGTAAS